MAGPQNPRGVHAIAILDEAYQRIGEEVHGVAAGLDATTLARRLDGKANPIGWLVWHLARVQDHHVSELAGRDQAWTSAGWHARFAMPADPSDTGYGHTSEQVAAVRPDGPAVLLGYYDAVAARTRTYLSSLDDDDLDRVVDRSYDPPVTVGVRLVSVLGDSLQHAGQAALVRGLVDGRDPEA